MIGEESRAYWPQEAGDKGEFVIVEVEFSRTNRPWPHLRVRLDCDAMDNGEDHMAVKDHILLRLKTTIVDRAAMYEFRNQYPDVSI